MWNARIDANLESWARLALFAGLALQLAAPALAATPSLTLVYFDAANLDPAASESMISEIESVLRGAGIEVESVDSELLTSGEWVPSGFFLKVILLGRSSEAMGLKPGILGVNLRTQAQTDTVYIFVPEIVRCAGFGDREPSAADTPSVGRALGRVVIHEVGHALDHEVPHSQNGIMTHAHDHRSLTYPGVRLHERAARAFLEAAAALNARDADAATTLVAGADQG